MVEIQAGIRFRVELRLWLVVKLELRSGIEANVGVESVFKLGLRPKLILRLK